MFTNQMQVMLYVKDVLASVAFWQSLGFVVIGQQEMDGTIVAEIAPSEEAELHFVIYDREFIEAHSPEVATNSPSIMFNVQDAEALYAKMQEQRVQMGELIQMGDQYVFNFADNDGNYYAVSGH